MTGKHSAFAAELSAMVTDLDRRALDFQTGISEIVDSAVHHVPGAGYAGITVAHKTKGIDTAAATHRYPILLDEVQQRHQDGPCLSAAWEHHSVRIDDLDTEQRWPKFSRDAITQTPIRSILSFELSVNTDSLIALNFYAEKVRAFDEESVDLGLMFAAHAALAWTMLRRDEQFRSGLASRDIIGQAKGVIMERFDIDAVQAFDLLRRLSQSSNTKLAVVAQQIVNTRGSAPSK